MDVFALLASPWFWLVLALGLAIFEITAPGTFLIWFGLGALLTAIIAFILPFEGTLILLLEFAVCSIVSVVFGREVYKRYMRSGDDADAPIPNQRMLAMIGSKAVVTKDFTAGTGHVKVGDTVWRASTEHDAALKSGDVVEVVETQSITLIVKPA